ncbi:hypothetical protein EPD60_02505 [Flaviaesturariibacter flavus]|uniref:Uncharacterized protein n=1 Tax=Flaviaesturariibacter flavus TaxID=2502780 RepID=A0A4R1BP11_9BACT|nr:hypothetical protein [Flaviaesturariibacter flavus]TCJ19309.1 hypothetical protein EPD60_02505 [Flaviaesturariibacter flavus]
MKIQLYALLAIAFSATTAVNAQCGTRNAQAFLEVRMPGIIPVDENRQPLRSGPDSSYSVFLESSSRKAGDGFAWINGRVYSAHVSRWEGSADIGKEKQSGETVRLATAAGASDALWRVELVPVKKKMKAPAKAGANQVVLQLNFSGKKCTQVIRRVTELAVPPAV